MASSFTKVPFIIRSIGSRAFKPVIRMSHGNSAAEKLTPKELRIPVPWGHIAAKTWNSTGPCEHLLLGLHGWLDNASTFDPIAELLPSNVHFVTFDFPGHGLSSHLPLGTGYNVVNYILDVKRTVDVLQWTKFSLLGHSMGAVVSNFFASFYPEMVEKIVCIDQTNFGWNPTPGSSSRIAFDEILEEARKPYQPLKLYAFDNAVKLLIAALGGKISEKSARILLTRGSTSVGNDLVYMNRDFKLRERYNFINFSESQIKSYMAGVKAEVLLLRGTKGLIASEKEIERSVFAYPPINAKKFEVIDIEGGHHFHLDNPEYVIDHICRFLQYKKSHL